MFKEIDNVTLASRLKGIEDSQNRARLAFFILTYATGATLFGLWNMYLSWERQWAYIKVTPKDFGQLNVLTQQIRSWVEGQSIGISLLGLRVSVSDINVLGTFILFVLSFYYCMCARRENHEIGGLLVDTSHDNSEIKMHVLSTVKSGMVINPTSPNDAPYRYLKETRKSKKITFSRSTQAILIYLPFIAILIALTSDLYFAFLYTSPWRNNSGMAWDTLQTTYKHQLIYMDLFGLLMGIGTLIFCRYSARYNRSTTQIFNEYCSTVKPENPA